MIEIDNFDDIIPILNFDKNYRSIILVWLVSRKKDGNTKVKGSNRIRTIKSYHFQSLDHLLEKRDEIIDLCKEFNCRAYICVNPKPLLNVLFTLQSQVMENIKQVLKSDTPVSLKGVLDSAVMKSGSNGDKKWIVDIDNTDLDYCEYIQDVINSARSGFASNIIKIIPTVHGYHLITHPFDTRCLSGVNVEIKKEGLTLLYCYLSQ